MVNIMEHGLPKFSLLGYDDWKIMMEAHLYALHDCMWMYIPKPKEKWDDRDCKKHNLDNVAKAAIFKTLDPITFSKIKHLETAMEIWQATTMEEGRNLENYTVQGLLDELRTYEHELMKKKEEQVTPFPKALMTTPRVPPSEGTCPRNCDTPSSSQPSSSKMENYDEEFAMMVKQFRKFKKFFKKADSFKRPSKGKPQVEKYGERERNEKKKKAMVAAESDESSSSSSDEEALVCMERRAEKSNHEDRWTMSEDDTLCLMAKDDAEQEVTSQTSCSSSYESIPTSESLFDKFKKMMKDFEEINLKHSSLTEENKLLSEENLKLTEGWKSQLDEITQLKTEKKSLSEKEAAKYPGVWYLDSGCSRHMTGDASLLSNLIPYDGPSVTFGGSNDFGLSKGLGNLVYKGPTIQAVSYVEGLNYNLLSISQFCDKGYSLEFYKDMASLKNISTNEVILTGKRIRNIYEVVWDDVKEACLISKDKDEEINDGDRMKPTEFIPFGSLPLKTSQRNPDSDGAEPTGNLGQPSIIPDHSNGDNSGKCDRVPIHPESPTNSVLQPEAELDQPVNPNQHNIRWLRDHPPQQVIRVLSLETSPLIVIKCFDDWKIMMEAHLYALHDCMWMVLEDGPLKIQMENPERNPTNPDEVQYIPKPKEKCDDRDCKKHNLDNIAKAAIFKTLDPITFSKIKHLKAAMEIRQGLGKYCEGSEDLRKQKIEVLLEKFKSFKMLPGESFDMLDERFHKILNDLASLNHVLSPKEKNVRKPGHWKSACPYPKVEKYGERERNEKKKKAMVAAKSDESSSSSSDEEALVCMERRAEKSNHEDRWTMLEDDTLCLMAKDDADREMMEYFEEINLKHSSLTEENMLLSEENLKLTEGRKSQLSEITQLKGESESLSEKVKFLNKELGLLKSKEAVDKLLETTKHKGREGLGFYPSSSKRKGRTTFIPPKPTAKPNKQKGKENEKPKEVPKKSNLILYDGPRVTFEGSNDFGLTKGLENLVYKGLTIQAVSYVEGLNYNLLSISQFCDKDYSLEFCKDMASLKNISTNEVILTGKRIRNIYEVMWDDVKEACLISKDEEINEEDRMKPTEFIPFGSLPMKTSKRNPDSAEPTANHGQPPNIPDHSHGDHSGNGDQETIHPETPTNSVLQPEAELDQPVNPNQQNLRWLRDHPPQQVIGDIQSGVRTRSAQQNLQAMLACFISTLISSDLLTQISEKMKIVGANLHFQKLEAKCSSPTFYQSYLEMIAAQELSEFLHMEIRFKYENKVLEFYKNGKFKTVKSKKDPQRTIQIINSTVGGTKVKLSQKKLGQKLHLPNSGVEIGRLPSKNLDWNMIGISGQVPSGPAKKADLNNDYKLVLELVIACLECGSGGHADDITQERAFIINALITKSKVNWAAHFFNSISKHLGKPNQKYLCQGLYIGHILESMGVASEGKKYEARYWLYYLSSKWENRAGASTTAEDEASSDNIPIISLKKIAKRKHVVSPSPSVEAPQNLALVNMEEEEEVTAQEELQRKKKRKITSPSTSGNVNPDELKEKEPVEENSAHNQSPQQLEEEVHQVHSLPTSSPQSQTDDADNQFWQLYYDWRAWKVGNSAEQLLGWDQQLKNEKIIKKCLGLPVNHSCEQILDDDWVWQRNYEDLHLEYLATTPVLEFEVDDEDPSVYKPIFSKATKDLMILTSKAQADLETTVEDFPIFPETSPAFVTVLPEADQENVASAPIEQNQEASEEEIQQPLQSQVLEIRTTPCEISNQRELEEKFWSKAEKEVQMAPLGAPETPVAVFEEQNEGEERDSLSRDTSNFILDEAEEESERTLGINNLEDVQEDVESLPMQLFQRTSSSHQKHSLDHKEISKSMHKTLEIISLLSNSVSDTMETYASDSYLQLKEVNKIREQIANVTVGLQKQMSLLQMDIRSALAVSSANQVVTKDYLKVIIDNQKEAHRLFRHLSTSSGNRKMEVILQQHSPSWILELPIVVKEGEVSYIPSHLNMTDLILEVQKNNPENSAQHLSSSGLDGTEAVGTIVSHFSNDAQTEERRNNIRRIKELCGNMQGISEIAGSSKRRKQ
ncbi:unnamed protein product [Cuscuta campestris]|uniref:Retrovirus-related Pol polyprotein from transposon TNT 1-94-like beta-barrel domain-containing protein n=1 Tax=Cuscuta campestris TaxID=132261 RepID=A0A484KT34_9ASTE|nr:unnamed protein product [Cuscuta campestris]